MDELATHRSRTLSPSGHGQTAQNDTSALGPTVIEVRCKLWPNLGHGHGSPTERKMAIVIGWPLLKLNASTRGPRW
jgi:hypothetical protein